ncbi:MAG: PQQ-binding-like beta-propeller repeat protein, partial [Prolixibacteraceae bacterium]|nr:PQQ-binding-like beta-propeller repeat protein [Prolixibacteraceae bacterium]
AITAEQINSNYNSFRGPWGNGVSTHKNIPVNWNGASGTNLLWKIEISLPGYNSPVIWGNKVFLSGGNKEVREIYCFDINSGNLLWSKKVENIPGSPAEMPKVSDDTGLAAPSLTTDGKRVFGIFANGDIICFDMNGNRVWGRNLGMPNNHYGHSSSLITWNNKVFVQFDTNSGGKVLALNAENGETVWETKRDCGISWASPVLAVFKGKMQVILTADPIVAGYDTETGEELWKVECMMGEVGPSVTTGEGMVFAANEYARLAAIDPLTATIKWEDDYYLPEVASPVCADGLLIVATSYGILVCYDAKTGDLLWEEDYGTGFYASPVVADNKIYAIDTDGVMHILELSREAKVLGSPKLGEEGFATPAFAEGKILIRGVSGLYCFGNK